MKTTIITLTYNHEGYVREALASALAQSRPADEIIVIDDASTDRTADVIEQFLRDVPSVGVRFVRNERNLGVAGSLAKAAAIAQGDIIFLMAGDDASTPGRIERCLAHFTEHPTAMAVITNASVIDGESRPVGVLDNCAGSKDVQALDLKGLTPGGHFLRGRSSCGAAAAYRADVFRLFAPLGAGLYAEDDPLAFRAMLLGTCDFIPEQLVRWRRHDRNLSHGSRNPRGPEMAVHFRKCEAMIDQMLADAEKWASGRPGHPESVLELAMPGLRFQKAKWRLWAAAHENGIRIGAFLSALFAMAEHRPWSVCLREACRPAFGMFLPFPLQRLLAGWRNSR